MGWVVSITPRPRFIPGEMTPGTHWIGGWVSPRAGLNAQFTRKILCLCRWSNPGRSVRSQTLYWLSYRGSYLLCTSRWIIRYSRQDSNFVCFVCHCSSVFGFQLQELSTDIFRRTSRRIISITIYFTVQMPRSRCISFTFAINEDMAEFLLVMYISSSAKNSIGPVYVLH
jgi:hypothetical protein